MMRMQQMFSRSMWGPWMAGLLVFGCLSSSSLAQVSNEQAARAIETVVGLDLGLNEPVSPSDYQLAMYLLEMATELNPTDADLARSLAESAWMCADHETLIDATRMIVQNDPGDTVAQLRLISAIINRNQTVEDRVKAYKRFVGEGAESIDVSIRSRLSMDLALLERERGNETGFLSALRDSAKLDPSNKQAQSLVAQHYSLGIQEASKRMKLQLRVLYADPLDPHVHTAIARMCAAEGATDVAWRFLNNAISIFRIDTGKAPAPIQEQQLSLLWQYEGPQAILDRLNPSLNDERETMQAKIDLRIAADEPWDDLQDPIDIRYEAGIDRIRLLAAYILEDFETVDMVLLDLQRGLEVYYGEVREQMQTRGVNKGRLLGEYLGEVVTFQTMRAIVGVDADVIIKDMDNIVAAAPEFERYFRPFEPFSQYAAGKYAEAKASAIEKLAVSAPRGLLIALCTEKMGDTDEAIELYTQLTLDYPLEATGALARSRLEELTQGSDLRTAEGEEMSEIASRIPLWLDKMIREPTNTMSLSITPTQSAFEPGEPAGLRIQLSNLTTIPLSLGGANPIDSNFLIVPGFREVDGEFRGTGRAKVLDLGRKLRLEPLEELVVEIDPDSIHTRWLIESQPQSVLRQRWRALQGFKPGPTGGIVNSPFALVSESPLVERRVLPQASASVDDLVSGIASSDDELCCKSVMGASAVLYSPGRRSDLTDADFGRLVNALWDRYAQSQETMRLWMLSILPTHVANPAMGSFDDRVQQALTSESLIETDLDSTLVAMVLLTRVEKLSSPVFDVARGHHDPRLVWMADLISERIKNLEPMYTGIDMPYSTFTPKLDRAFGS